MAFCPDCGAEMGQLDTSCQQCGYDFPKSAPVLADETPFYIRLAFSPLANVAIFLVLAAFLIGIPIGILFIPIHLFSGRLGIAIQLTFGVVYSLAMVAILIRVMTIKPPEN